MRLLLWDRMNHKGTNVKFLFILCACFACTCFAADISDLEKSCNDDEDAQACLELGNLYFEGTTVAQSYPDAQEYYRKSCWFRCGEACFNLGNMYKYNQGMDQDEDHWQMAKRYFNKACQLGFKTGCEQFEEEKQGEPTN